MRPTIEEIKEGFKKCGLKPVQWAFLDDAGCCGLTAYAAYLGLPVPQTDEAAIQLGMADRLGVEFVCGFIVGWDGEPRDGESMYIENNEGYELGRAAWEACKCVS